MALHWGMRLFLLFAMPVYAVLIFILVFDTYTPETEGRINNVRGRRGTGPFFSFRQASSSSSSSSNGIPSPPLIRKLTAFRGYPDPVEENFQGDSALLKPSDGKNLKSNVNELYNKMRDITTEDIAKNSTLNQAYLGNISNSSLRNSSGGGIRETYAHSADTQNGESIKKLKADIAKQDPNVIHDKDSDTDSIKKIKSETKQNDFKGESKLNRIDNDFDYNYESDEDSENDFSDYDWSVDQYKYKNYVKHFLFTDLFHPRFILENAELCRDNPRVFVFINSKVNNTGIRNTIRQTYLQQLVDNNISHAFMISNPGNEVSMRELQKENQAYGDLILVEGNESYINLTLKTGHLLHWSRKNCPSTTYIAKIDDDVYLNVPQFLRILATPRQSTILGKICSACVPYRGAPFSLREALRLFSNIVTRRHMPLTRFPPFAMGPAYVITNDITGWLLEAAQHLSYFSYEDVFWTGLVVEVVNQESGITFEPPDEVKEKEQEEEEEEEESIKVKYFTMKEGQIPRVNIARENIPNWRSDRRISDSLPDALQKSQASVIVHGMQWDKDKMFVDAMQNMTKIPLHERLSPDSGSTFSNST